MSHHPPATWNTFNFVIVIIFLYPDSTLPPPRRPATGLECNSLTPPNLSSTPQPIRGSAPLCLQHLRWPPVIRRRRGPGRARTRGAGRQSGRQSRRRGRRVFAAEHPADELLIGDLCGRNVTFGDLPSKFWRERCRTFTGTGF